MRLVWRILLATPMIAAMAKAGSGDDVSTAINLFSEGDALIEKGRYADAEILYRQGIAIDENVFGTEHLEYARAISVLAEICSAQNRDSEAEALFRRALAIRQKRLPPDAVDVGVAFNNLGTMLYKRHAYVAAEPNFRKALSILEQKYGSSDIRVAVVLNNLGNIYLELGYADRALDEFRHSLRSTEASHDTNFAHAAIVMNNIARIYLSRRDYKHAEAYLVRSIALEADRRSLSLYVDLLRKTRRAESAKEIENWMNSSHVGQRLPAAIDLGQAASSDRRH